jgi:hypothetical protein
LECRRETADFVNDFEKQVRIMGKITAELQEAGYSSNQKLLSSKRQLLAQIRQDNQGIKDLKVSTNQVMGWL